MIDLLTKASCYTILLTQQFPRLMTPEAISMDCCQPSVAIVDTKNQHKGLLKMIVLINV